VLAIGNPFGVGQTVTSGIVSALARPARGVSDYSFFIQTDAAINPGNSGGALVNMDGQLVGINTAIFTPSGGSIGIGFAIPSNMVQAVLRKQGKGGDARGTPWFGATMEPVTPEIAESLGLERIVGALLNSVEKGSPADHAGLKSGDVILTLNDKEIDSPGALHYRVATAQTGEKLKLAYWRAGKKQETEIKLDAPPETTPRDKLLLKGDHPLNGVTVMNLSPRVAQELGLSMSATTAAATGVVIADPGPKSQFGVGIEKGDIITEVNGKPVANTKDLAALLTVRKRSWDIVMRRGAAILHMQVVE